MKIKCNENEIAAKHSSLQAQIAKLEAYLHFASVHNISSTNIEITQHATVATINYMYADLE
jgi:hypothetical protein